MPPTSAAIRSPAIPSSPASAATAATPATGPDMIVSNGRSAASSNVIAPPPDRVMKQAAAEAALAEPLLEAPQVPAHAPAHEGVDDGRAGPLVLAVLARDADARARSRRRSPPRAAAARPRARAPGSRRRSGRRRRSRRRPRPGSSASAARTSPGSSGTWTVPSARTRSRTGRRRRRGTSGAGRRPEQVVGVVAVSAPDLEHVAEAARRRGARPSRPGARAARSGRRWCRARTPRRRRGRRRRASADRLEHALLGRAGRASTLPTTTAPVRSSRTMRSVNVPPTSTPTRSCWLRGMARTLGGGPPVAQWASSHSDAAIDGAGGTIRRRCTRWTSCCARRQGSGLTLVAGPWDARGVEAVTIVDAMEELGAAPPGAIAILTRHASSLAAGYELDVALRVGAERQIAALAVYGESMTSITADPARRPGAGGAAHGRRASTTSARSPSRWHAPCATTPVRRSRARPRRRGDRRGRAGGLGVRARRRAGGDRRGGRPRPRAAGGRRGGARPRRQPRRGARRGRPRRRVHADRRGARRRRDRADPHRRARAGPARAPRRSSSCCSPPSRGSPRRSPAPRSWGSRSTAGTPWPGVEPPQLEPAFRAIGALALARGADGVDARPRARLAGRPGRRRGRPRRPPCSTRLRGRAGRRDGALRHRRPAEPASDGLRACADEARAALRAARGLRRRRRAGAVRVGHAAADARRVARLRRGPARHRAAAGPARRARPRPRARRRARRSTPTSTSSGSLVRCAERLHLHRNAVGYRMRAIREQLGVDLDDPDQRLALQLACRSRLLEGDRPPAAHRSGR